MKKHIKDVETQKPHWKNKNLSWSWHSQLRAKATLSVLQGPCKSEPRHLLNRLNTKSPSDRKASHASTDLGQSATLRSLWKLSEPRKKPLLYKQPGFFSLLIWFQWTKKLLGMKTIWFQGTKKLRSIHLLRSNPLIDWNIHTFWKLTTVTTMSGQPWLHLAPDEHSCRKHIKSKNRKQLQSNCIHQVQQKYLNHTKLTFTQKFIQ